MRSIILFPGVIAWIYLYLLSNPSVTRQLPSENHARGICPPITSQNVSILFWNVENLYDPYDDSTRLDEEFTPGGSYHWTWTKFRQKLSHLSKTILASGNPDPPALAGFCEVENRWVLNRLIYDTPLKIWQYRVIHFDSPDRRGVDVGCIYRPSIFKPLVAKPILVRFPFDTAVKTRDILYIKGLIGTTDTLHVFINHWPSRRGGEETSRPRRNYTASLLRQATDSILSVVPDAAIIITGDFNDEPRDESLSKVLCAADPGNSNRSIKLINLMLSLTGKEGTHKFQGHWGILDQFIVASHMLQPEAALQTSADKVTILRFPFLMEEDSRYFGEKPFRTYIGPRYHGGFSDHLPVRLILCRPIPIPR